jgi:hypothetical protein
MPMLDGTPAGRERRLFPVLVGGALIGLAVLTRPAMLFFLPFALLLSWRARPAFAVAMVAGMLAVVLPWTARNAVVYGRFVLVASEGGVTFWTGNHREALGEGDLAANPHLKRLNQEFRARHRGLTEEELEPIYYREALNFIVDAPLRWLGLVAKKLFYTWVPIGPSYRLHSPRYFWTSVIAYGALLPVAIAGFIGLWRAGRRPWTLWALAGSTVVVSLLFFPQERFRIPVIDPTLIICAAADGADMVIGSRYLHGVSVVNWPLRRLFLSTFANNYIPTVTRMPVRDCTSGYRCWRRQALTRIPLERIVSDGYAFLVEMLYEAHRRGCKIGEVPIIFVERRVGNSKMSSNVILESIYMPWRMVLRGMRGGA